MNLYEIADRLQSRGIPVNYLDENEAAPGTVMLTVPCVDDNEAQGIANNIQAAGYGKNWMHWDKPIDDEDEYVFDFDTD